MTPSAYVFPDPLARTKRYACEPSGVKHRRGLVASITQRPDRQLSQNVPERTDATGEVTCASRCGTAPDRAPPSGGRRVDVVSSGTMAGRTRTARPSSPARTASPRSSRRRTPPASRRAPRRHPAGVIESVSVKIKLKRLGKIRSPYYRIVVADARTKRDGRSIEEIGQYHPKEDPSLIEVDSERALYWLGVGAQPTEPCSPPVECWRGVRAEPSRQVASLREGRGHRPPLPRARWR